MKRQKINITMKKSGEINVHFDPALPDNAVYPRLSEALDRVVDLAREALAVGHRPDDIEGVPA